MRNAFIFHGAANNPSGNWFPWLQQELERIGYTVIVPTFPTPEGQNLTNWLEVAKPFLKQMDIQTLLIGHSIGATFILRVLEQLNSTVAASYLVSGFINDLKDPFFNNLNHTFYEQPFDWKKIKQNSKKFYQFHGNNDPYVSQERAQELAEKLQIHLTNVKNGGHLNIEAGFKQFPQLLERIKKSQ